MATAKSWRRQARDGQESSEVFRCPTCGIVQEAPPSDLPACCWSCKTEVSLVFQRSPRDGWHAGRMRTAAGRRGVGR